MTDNHKGNGQGKKPKKPTSGWVQLRLFPVKPKKG
jgi:hypothetical protein